MNFSSKITIIFLALSFWSCEKNDNTTTEEENQETLILRQIEEGKEGNLLINFDEKGRLSFSENLEATDLPKATETTYDVNNRKKQFTSYANNGSLISTITYFYGANGEISEIIQEFPNPVLGIMNFTNTLSYSNNVITSNIRINDIEKYIIAFRFNDITYERLENVKVLDIIINQKIFEEDYEYSIEGNLIKNTILNFNNEVIETNTYTYDDRKNAFSESNSPYYLNEILKLNGPVSLSSPLILLSKNNVISSIPDNNQVTIEYNSQNYPIKKTFLNKRGEITNLRFFEYYQK